jgi:hypothetical protein
VSPFRSPQVCGQAYDVCPFSTNERLRGKRKNRPDHVFPAGSGKKADTKADTTSNRPCEKKGLLA